MCFCCLEGVGWVGGGLSESENLSKMNRSRKNRVVERIAVKGIAWR